MAAKERCGRELLRLNAVLYSFTIQHLTTPSLNITGETVVEYDLIQFYFS